MKLTPVIAALRARCPYFENRVAGAAQFKNLPEVGKLKLPAAYVVPVMILREKTKARPTTGRR
ncbi:phage protein [Escherichia coli]|uniref:Phage protein n=1 Tax=Escherichia coli TaxID=562 RepID=A0A377E2U0_ECOLX|nr:phage protein [Escherichia coli]